jgi:AAA+ ATPase superfamily predicted ATPase
MFLGRSEETEKLEKYYTSGKSSLVVLYGRKGIGKTSLIKNFAKGKEYFYYCGAQASNMHQISMLTDSIKKQVGFYSVDEREGKDLTDTDVLMTLMERLPGGTKLVVIDEFQNIIRQNKGFMQTIVKLVEGKLFDGNVCVVLVSSSISWIENSLVSAIGSAALKINEFIKVKELTFVDTVRMFPTYSVPDSMMIYAVTGGVPDYMCRLSDKLSVRENVCRNILAQDSYLRHEGSAYISEELRETSVYNTIIKYIADGANKLNDLHNLTGFGRDKVSVYLKNLSEREIVEKVFSYDSDGREYTKKGLYRIKSGFTEFWFRYIFGMESLIEMMEPEKFYDDYIAPTLNEFALEAFVKVGTEYISIMDEMGKLPVKIERTGRWWGKNGNIDIIAVSHDQKYVIGKCSWLDETFRFSAFEELMENVELAHIGKDYIYLFSKNDFDDRLKEYASENENVKLVSLKEL